MNVRSIIYLLKGLLECKDLLARECWARVLLLPVLVVVSHVCNKIIIIIIISIIIIIIRTGVSKSCKLQISEFTDNSDYL